MAESIFSDITLRLLHEQLAKRAFIDAATVDPSMAGGMPPGAMPPGGAPPMDPAMAGGMPPGAMPMDPSMMGGMPPGAAPPMDPSMMGGAPPVDPSMAGGAPPVDPAAGGAPPAPAAEAPLTADSVRQIVQEALAAGGVGGKPKEKKVDPNATIAAMQSDLQQTKMLLAHICSSLNLPIDPKALLQPPATPPTDSEGGGGESSGGDASGQKTAKSCGYPGRGVRDSSAVSSLRDTLDAGGVSGMAEKASAVLDILKARRRAASN